MPKGRRNQCRWSNGTAHHCSFTECFTTAPWDDWIIFTRHHNRGAYFPSTGTGRGDCGARMPATGRAGSQTGPAELWLGSFQRSPYEQTDLYWLTQRLHVEHRDYIMFMWRSEDPWRSESEDPQGPSRTYTLRVRVGPGTHFCAGSGVGLNSVVFSLSKILESVS
jgi:hypothetical protein